MKFQKWASLFHSGSWAGQLRDLVDFLNDNPDGLVKFAEGMMGAAGTSATYAIAAKIIQIGAALLALNPWALLITGVVASGAIVYKTWSASQANLERSYMDMRCKALQYDLYTVEPISPCRYIARLTWWARSSWVCGFR